MNKLETEVHETLSAINKAWRTARPSDMSPHLHPDIVMKFPGFSGEVVGREKFLSGFVEFCENARVIEYSETDEQITVVGDCAIASFRFDMVYERSAYRERSKGRDLWVFSRISNRWVAVWRTMMDVVEARETKGG